MIGCQCPICLSDDPKDKRLRQSIVIKTDNGNQVLVDTTPDLRTQMLREDIRSIDATIITHDHADHVHGVDDLRAFTFGMENPMPVYVNEDSAQELSKKFSYIFQSHKVFPKDRPVIGGGIPKVEMKPVGDQKLEVSPGDQFEFKKMPHGYTTTLSVKYKKMLYLTDLKEIPKKALDQWAQEQLDIVIIDCLQVKPHATHLNMDEAFHYLQQLAPKKAYLIHMNHHFFHKELANKAKSHFNFPVEPAYDTMQLSF